MIDPRYPPQGNKVIIPLYPLSGRTGWLNLVGGTDKNMSPLFQRLGYEPPNCVFGSSARLVLIYFLSWLRGHSSREPVIGVPSYYCPHTAAMMACMGFQLIFLDLDDDLSLSPESVRFARQHGCNVVIWPSYFGYRSRRRDSVDAIVDAGMILISDEAHAFPFAQEFTSQGADGNILLFSFGSNKPVAGIGGGGLIIRDKHQAREFKEFAAATAVSLQPEWPSILRALRDARRVASRWRTSPWRRFFRSSPDLYTDLHDHLDAILPGILAQSQPILYSMSSHHARVAHSRWLRLEAMRSQYSEYVAALTETISCFAGSSSIVSRSSCLGPPSIFAIRVRANVRFALASALARHGIQSTWYYYPLTLQRFFAACTAEPMHNTSRLSGEVLILPCQWTHVELGLHLGTDVLRSVIECTLTN